MALHPDDPTAPHAAAPDAPAPAENAQLVDVVSEDNEALETLPRGEVHARGLRHRSVHIALFDARGRIFLHRRSRRKVVLPGHWDISAAGHCDPSETYRDAARRELGEELAVESPLTPLYVTTACEQTGWEFAALFWGQTADPEAVLPARDEIEGSCWLTAEELTAFLGDRARPVASSLLNHLAHLLDAPEPIAPLARWSAAERESVRDAVAAHPAFPGLIPCHQPSLGLIVAEDAIPVAAVSSELERREGILPRLQRHLARVLFFILAGAMGAGLLAYPMLVEEGRLLPWLLDTARELRGGDTRLPASVAVPLAHLLDREAFVFLSGLIGTLELKEGAVGTLALLAIPFLVALLVLRQPAPLLRRPVVGAGVALLVWMMASVAFVLPEDHAYLGVVTLGSVLLFSILVAASATALDSARMQARMIRWTGIVTGLVALAALGQHFDLVGWLPRADTERNRMSATIGHNNGVAAALMYAWFPCVAGLFLARSRSRRWLLAGALALLVFIFLALQTRAAWVILLLLTPVQVAMLARLARWRPRLSQVLVGLALLLLFALAQSVGGPHNPLRGDVPLTQRLRDLSPARMRESTQWRIVTFGSTYMAQDAGRFLLGTGLGSFVAEYPRMAESYLARRQLDVDLYVPADRRTAQAHSDVLQVFLELGAVGLVLLFVLVMAFVRDVERAYHSLPDAFARSYALAIVFPLAATALHGVVEFPFHVASTMALFCVFAGMAFSLGRAWGGTPDAVRPEEALAARFRPSPPLRPNALQRLLLRDDVAGRAARVGALVGFGLLAVASAWLMVPWQARVVSSFWQENAIHMLELYLDEPELHSTDEGNRMLASARDAVTAAVRANPANPELAMLLGRVRYLQAEWYTRLLRRAEDDPAADEELRAEWRRLAALYFGAAIEAFERGRRTGADYYQTRYVAALAHRDLAGLLAGPDRDRHRLAYERCLNDAIRLNPAFAPGVLEAIRFYAVDPVRHDATLRLLRRLLARYHPKEYERVFILPFHDALKFGSLQQATGMLAEIQKDMPDDLDWRFQEVLVLAAFHHVEAARLLLHEVSRRAPDYPRLPDIRMIVELADGKWEEALFHAEESLARPGRGEDTAYLQAVQAFLAEKLARKDAVELVRYFNIDAFEDRRRGTALRRAAMSVLHLYLGETDRAIPYIERQLEDPEPPEARFLLVYLEHLARELAALGEAADPGTEDEVAARRADLAARMRTALTRGLSFEPESRPLRQWLASRHGAGSEEARAILDEALAARRARERADREVREAERLRDRGL